jgi:hypothetical protein
VLPWCKNEVAMRLMYVALVPIVLFILHKRTVLLIAAIKTKNKSKLKSSILFLSLSLVIIGLLVWLIEWFTVIN